MRIFCSICKELFIPYSEINATACGHLYHGSCISRWFKQHKTCPQCRASLTSQPIRIYFDVDKDNEIDASTLEHQLENVTSELRQIQVDNKILREKNEKNEKTLKEIEFTSADLKQKNNILKASVKALKQQIVKLGEEKEKVESIKKDLEDLKVKMRAYESLEHIINCSSEEANKLLKITPVTEFGLKQLSIYTSALKDKTEQDKKKITELVNEKKELEKALVAEQMKNAKSSTNSDYMKLKKSYDNLNSELSFAKDLVKQLSQKMAKGDNEIHMLQGQSQAPKKRPLFTINIDLGNGDEKDKKGSGRPELSDSIKHWEDLIAAGPSQQLRVSTNSKDVEFLKSKKVSSNRTEQSSHSNYAFDGMGGSKKICLGHPTPQDEFLKLKTENKSIEKLMEKKRKDMIFGKKAIDITKSKNILGYLGSNERKHKS